MPQYTTHYLNGTQRLIEVLADPDNCPICRHALQPKVLSAQYLEPQQRMQVLYRCTRNACQESFIATFNPIPGGAGRYVLTKTEPARPPPPAVPATVAAISPTYVEIVSQVAQAESQSLTQLVGIGLRKALEFLIKDYLCHKHAERTEQIKLMPLGACINEFIEESSLKTCARRATWLGNDETHYIRKWADKDLQDLKILTALTVNWIESHLLTDQYEKAMTPK